MKPWKIILLVGAVLLVGAATFVFFGVRAGRALDASSHAFVDEAVLAIASRWDLSALESRASPEFLKTTPKEKLETLVEFLSHKLGPLQHYDGAKGQSLIFYSNHGKQISAHYLVRAQFAQGPATIDVRLVRHGAKWSVLGFHVESDALMK